MHFKLFVFFLVFTLLKVSFGHRKPRAVPNDTFPEDFKFGVATAAYQIEGAWNKDGKAESIWDYVTHQYPNWIVDGQNADIACDSYHLWHEDVRNIKSLDVDYYRFSLSWPRLLPSGHSNYVNPLGIRYYNNLIDELIKNDIEPIVTLYHWDLPQSLQNLGGWANIEMAKYFENYANVAFGLFGDRVKKWITFNEPFEICQGGYGEARRAPLLKSSGIADYLCGKTLLVAHGKAYQSYNNNFRASQNGIIGFTISAFWYEPKTKSTEDLLAAERVRQMDYGWFLHPILSGAGDYPEIMIDQVKFTSSSENYTQSRLPPLTMEEIVLIRGSCDFLGVNHYTTKLVSDLKVNPQDPTSYAKDTSVLIEDDPNWLPTAASWLHSVPWGFRKLLQWFKFEYNNPLIYITENGFADDGNTLDLNRIKYLRSYLQELLKAIHFDGCNVKAYIAWSLMDNMEWNDGYSVRFGLYHVNFSDPQRTRSTKLSTSYYRNVVQSGKTSGFGICDKITKK